MGTRTLFEILLSLYSLVITFIAISKNKDSLLKLNLTRKEKTKYWNSSDWGKLLPTPSDNKIK